jgi:hypothetical protein
LPDGENKYEFDSPEARSAYAEEFGDLAQEEVELDLVPLKFEWWADVELDGVTVMALTRITEDMPEFEDESEEGVEENKEKNAE